MKIANMPFVFVYPLPFLLPQTYTERKEHLQEL